MECPGRTLQFNGKENAVDLKQREVQRTTGFTM